MSCLSLGTSCTSRAPGPNWASSTALVWSKTLWRRRPRSVSITQGHKVSLGVNHAGNGGKVGMYSRLLSHTGITWGGSGRELTNREPGAHFPPFPSLLADAGELVLGARNSDFPEWAPHQPIPTAAPGFGNQARRHPVWYPSTLIPSSPLPSPHLPSPLPPLPSHSPFSG